MGAGLNGTHPFLTCCQAAATLASDEQAHLQHTVSAGMQCGAATADNMEGVSRAMTVIKVLSGAAHSALVHCHRKGTWMS